MTNAIFNYNNNQIKSFKIIGHADYAEYGYDIVCSGITTSVFTSLGLIKKYLEQFFILMLIKNYLLKGLLIDVLALIVVQFITLKL